MDGIREILIVVKVMANNDFSYEYINKTAIERTGLKESDVEKSIFEVESRGNAAYYCKNHRQVVQTKQKMQFEDSYMSPEGKLYYSEVKLTPLFDEEKVTHIVILVHDITDKKLAEMELVESKERLNESKLKYQSLFQYNLDTIFSLNLSGQVLITNLATKSLTGYTSNEFVGLSPKDLVLKQDKEIVEKCFKKAIAGIAASANVRAIDKNNQQVELIVKFIPIIVNTQTTGVYAILRDVTEEKDLVKKLMESEKHFRVITENTEDLIALIEVNGKIAYLSPSCERILGFKNYKTTGCSYIDYIHPDDQTKFIDTFEKAVEEKNGTKTLYRMKNRHGDFIWLEMAATPIFNENDNLIHIVAISRDMTLRLEYEERLKYFASHDFLTNLENRRSFKNRLTESLARFNKKQSDLALVMIDIDYFKEINDRYGHDVGDRVLARFAQCLSDTVGEESKKFRFGGDEFAIIIENTTKSDVSSLVEMIQTKLKSPFQVDNHDLEITLSVGIAIAEGPLIEPLTENLLIKKADLALYEAKEAGRNCYKIKETL